jgi:hypothetical protein
VGKMGLKGVPGLNDKCSLGMQSGSYYKWDGREENFVNMCEKDRILYGDWWDIVMIDFLITIIKQHRDTWSRHLLFY